MKYLASIIMLFAISAQAQLDDLPGQLAAVKTIMPTAINAAVIFNPMTIAFWLGILGAALAARPRERLGIELLYVASLMVGCLLWVLLLSVGLHFGRSFVRGPALRIVSAVAGISLIAFGLQFALRAF